jgi:hypothetical protein
LTLSRQQVLRRKCLAATSGLDAASNRTPEESEQ